MKDILGPWKNYIHSKSSYNFIGQIFLSCYCYPKSLIGRLTWVGMVSLGSIHSLEGPRRRSVELAQRDAEKLAEQLLLDIRDGVKQLMIDYEVENNN